MNADMRLITYNLGQGGSRSPAVWARALLELAPDLLFVQESREPAHSWLSALPGTHRDSWLWSVVPGGRWGSGMWVRTGHLTPLAVPEAFTGRVAAAIIEGCTGPASDYLLWWHSAFMLPLARAVPI